MTVYHDEKGCPVTIVSHLSENLRKEQTNRLDWIKTNSKVA